MKLLKPWALATQAIALASETKGSTKIAIHTRDSQSTDHLTDPKIQSELTTKLEVLELLNQGLDLLELRLVQLSLLVLFIDKPSKDRQKLGPKLPGKSTTRATPDTRATLLSREPLTQLLVTHRLKPSQLGQVDYN